MDLSCPPSPISPLGRSWFLEDVEIVEPVRLAVVDRRLSLPFQPRLLDSQLLVMEVCEIVLRVIVVLIAHFLVVHVVVVVNGLIVTRYVLSVLTLSLVLLLL